MELLRLLTSSFFVVFLFINCTFPEKNCNNFKTGSFEFKSTIDGKDYVSKFIRVDSKTVKKIRKANVFILSRSAF